MGDGFILESNQAMLDGKVASAFTFSHKQFGEEFYRAYIDCERWSGTVDTFPILISSRLVDAKRDYTGRAVEVTGQLRSRSTPAGKKNRLELFLFVKDITFPEFTEDDNKILLDGYICKEPVYRETPLGRHVTDLLLAVNRAYGKSDYIPCIAWERNAKYVSGLGVGAHLKVEGRMQSREYLKKTGDTYEPRTAYEVSINMLEMPDGDHASGTEE